MASANTAQAYDPIKTSKSLVSLPGLYAVVWVAIMTCTLLFAGRVYIRIRFFSKLLIDDWLMLFSWALLVSAAASAQVCVKDIYMLLAVSAGEMMPTPDFPALAQQGLRAFGVASLCLYLGIYAIKLNFLVFFRRLIWQVRAYSIFWWIVLSISMACGVVSIGLMQFHCLFGPIDYVMLECPKLYLVSRTYDFYKLTCIVDIISDALIICSPVVVLWNIRITLKKKIILSGILFLVSFTTAITIVRGSIFGGSYKSVNEHKRMAMNAT